MAKQNVRPARKKVSAAATTAAMGAAVVVSLSGLCAHNALADTAPMNIQALIIPTGQDIIATQDLNFGNVVQGGAGTVSVNTAGTPSYGGGAQGAGGIITEGVVRVYNPTNVLVTYTVPAAVTITNGGTGNMVVNNFNIGTNAGGNSEAILMTANSMQVPIGGTLNVGGASPTGTYTGTVTVTATFN